MSFTYLYIDNNIYSYANSFELDNKNIETLKCSNDEINLYTNYLYSKNIEEKELNKKEILYHKLNNFGCALKDYETYLQNIEKKEKILEEDLSKIIKYIDSLFEKYKKIITHINIKNNFKNNLKNNFKNNETGFCICTTWVIFQIFCFICGIQKIFEFIFMPPFNSLITDTD